MMVFVNKIKNVIEIERYLQSRLSNCIFNRNQAFVIIQFIISNLNTNSKTKIMKIANIIIPKFVYA